MRFESAFTSLVVVALISFAGLPRAAADDGDSKDVPENPEALRERIATIVEEHDAPGAGVAVVEDGEVTLADGFGLADRGAEREADAQTPFRLGSVSKTFVGLTAMRLVLEGELDLRDRVDEIAPELPVENPYRDEQPIRIAHLLEHTAGFSDIGLATTAASRRGISALEAVTFDRSRWLARWPPGDRWAYSNIGPTMVAHIVESTAGRPFDAVSREQIFEPLGMDSAVWRPGDSARERIATGYRADGKTPLEYRDLVVWPAGALSMSPRDLGTFLRMMMARGTLDGKQILTPKAIHRIEHPRTVAAARHLEVGYGLGVATHVANGRVVHGHNGGMLGHRASYRYIPGVAGFAFSTNSAGVKTFSKLKELLMDYITRTDEPPDYEVRDTEEPDPPPVADVPDEVLDARTGYYEVTSLRHEWTAPIVQLVGIQSVGRTDRGLELSALVGGSTETLLPVEHNDEGLALRTPEGPRATAFAFDAGRIQFSKGMGTATLEPVSPVLAFGRPAALLAAILAVLSAVLFSFVWVPRWMFGSLESDGLAPRGATAAAGWLFVLTVAVFFGALRTRWIQTLATVNGWTVAIAGFTGLFGVASVGSGGVVVYDEWKSEREVEDWGRWLARWHTRLVAAALVGLTLYLGAYGFIALRTWTL